MVAKARGAFAALKYGNPSEMYDDMRSTLRHCANEIEKLNLECNHLEAEVGKLDETLRRERFYSVPTVADGRLRPMGSAFGQEYGDGAIFPNTGGEA